jgi:multisubunit Na+/H+ antiporter MnhG subunit
MSGSVLFAVITFVILFVVGIFMSPWFLIPAVFVAVFALLSAPFMAALRGRGGAREGSGTPSTSEASYDPVATPGERTV